MLKKALFCVLVYLCLLPSPFAETIILKSGQKVEGKITEKTDKYLKIDFQGVPLTYYYDEIENIKEEADNSSSSAGILYNFKLGSNNIEGNDLIFEFPEGMNTLYLFSTTEWKGLRGNKVKLIVDLYDKNRSLITSVESACIATNMKPAVFGSIPFSAISLETIKNIAYFSVAIQDCPKKEIVAPLEEDKPEVKFAKRVETVIREGKEAYWSLFASKPESEEKIRKTEEGFMMLEDLLKNGGGIVGVSLMDKKDALAFKNICSEPCDIKFQYKSEEKKGEGFDSGEENMELAIKIPIGKVNGEWKILNIE